MNDRDREQVKDRLRALDQDQGARIDTPQHWAVKGIQEPRRFFEHLSLLMAPPAVLYFEGTTIHPEAASFYLKHAPPHPTAVACDTVFPVPDVYHVDLAPEAVAGIVDLLSRRFVRELFDHFKGYKDAHVIFTFHDAFEGCLRISGSIPEATVAGFCRALDVSYVQEVTKGPDMDALRHLLRWMENPEKVKMPRIPWWRRIADEFMAGFRKK